MSGGVGVGVDVGAMWLRLTLAVRPVLTSRPAVLKCSEVILTWPNLPSSCGVAGRVKESEETSATLWCSTALAVREGKGVCAHEDENGGHDREEDSEAQHNATARGGEERTSAIKPRG